MYRKKECVAMLLAGGQGSRLYVLTKNVAKPAVPFGGKYRIIDFPLSNCTNSGIDTVGVLTQYEPHVLNAYIGSGQTWDLDRLRGGVYVLPPYQKGKASEWYKGTANAIYQNIAFIDEYDPEYVLILSGDHIYKMNYNKMLYSSSRPARTRPSRCWTCRWPRSRLRHHDLQLDDADQIEEAQARKPRWRPWAFISSPGKSCASI